MTYYKVLSRGHRACHGGIYRYTPNRWTKRIENIIPCESGYHICTLDQLAREMKLPPRDARMLLRLAAKQTKLYPTLGKDHVARQPWQWAPGSKALEEARKALSATPTV
jgi:hypothetical protein